MTYESVEDVRGDDGLDLAYRGADLERLLSAIDERLADLQRGSPEGTTPPEHYALVDARRVVAAELKRRPSTELALRESQAVERVAIAALEAIGSAQANATQSETPLARLERQKSAALTKASSDFRRSRSLPLGGLTGASGVALIFRLVAAEPVPIGDSTVIDSQLVLLPIFMLVSAIWAVAVLMQHRDERSLKDIFDPDVQADALYACLEAAWDERVGLEAEIAVSRRDYMRHLANAANARPHQSLFDPSTVDIDGALREATSAALERFVVLGWLEPVKDGMRERYRPVSETSE